MNYVLLKGPDLPDTYDKTSHELVSNGKTIFYVNSYNRVILRLDCPTDLASCKWTTLEQKLSISRHQALSLMVPDELVKCSKMV